MTPIPKLTEKVGEEAHEKAESIMSYIYGKSGLWPSGMCLRIEMAIGAAFRAGMEAAATECQKASAEWERVAEFSADPDTRLCRETRGDQSAALAHQIRSLAPKEPSDA